MNEISPVEFKSLRCTCNTRKPSMEEEEAQRFSEEEPNKTVVYLLQLFMLP